MKNLKVKERLNKAHLFIVKTGGKLKPWVSLVKDILWIGQLITKRVIPPLIVILWEW